MFYFSRGEQVALALLVVALVAAAGAMWWVGARESVPTEPFFVDAPGTATGETVTVHVCGEVGKPGLYTIAAGTRVNEVLRVAGGTTARADLSAVNLAAEVVDGQQIAVPARAQTSASSAASTPPVGKPQPSRPGGGAASSPPFAGKVSINRADLAQLDRLPGIGPTYARRIIEYRQRLKAETGQGFTRVEQLMEVPGIGPKRFADIKGLVTL